MSESILEVTPGEPSKVRIQLFVLSCQVDLMQAVSFNVLFLARCSALEEATEC
jgi:hypothetical protein